MDSRSNLERMTCVQLRELSGKRGLKKSGKKEDLIDRLMGKEPIKDKKKKPKASKDLKTKNQSQGNEERLNYESKTCEQLKDLLEK